MKNKGLSDTASLIFKISLGSFLAVWLSSYCQLIIFQNSRYLSWEEALRDQANHLLVIAFFVDFGMLIYAFISSIYGKNSSIFPIVGWFFIFFSTFFYGKSIFLNWAFESTIMRSFERPAEFIVLSLFHFFIMYIAGIFLKKNS